MIGNSRFARIVAVVVVALLVITLAASLFGCGPSGQASGGTAGTRAAQPAKDPVSGLAYVAVDDLPPEARDTLALIDSGGPFPYDRDGAVFGNFEKLLPRQNRGYYREYTVRTPGERDRGARRIVAGRGGERYYTEDHYQSFRRIATDGETDG